VSTLRDRAVTGVRWSLASHGGKQVLQLVTTAVLVRLLAPEDFGVMGMAMVVVGLSALLQDLGTAAAVVHRETPSERLLSSIFWLNAVGGCVVGLVIVAIAPLVGGFFDEAYVADLLVLLAPIFLAAGLATAHGALLQRELRFRSLARLEFAATAIGATLGIGAAFLGLGVLSLAAQALAASFTRTGLLWIACRWRPGLCFSWREIRSVGGYGLGLTGFKLVNYGARNLDSLLIGKVLGATELGWYTIAYKLMLYPVQHVSAVIGRVMFPVYARWQDDTARLRRAYVRVSAAIATITFPVMLGVMATSGPLVHVLLGPQWTPVALLLTILAPLGMIQSLGTQVGGIFQATGRTGLFLLYGVGLAALMALAFVIGVRWGIFGVATAYAVAQIIAVYPAFRLPFGLIGLPMREFTASVWRPLACALAMAVVVALVPLVIGEAAPLHTLIVQVLVGIVSYAAMSWGFNRVRLREVLGVAMPVGAATS
jgi:PST family polysaccharide transporter